MYRKNFFDSFKFYNNLPLNQKIQTIATVQLNPFTLLEAKISVVEILSLASATHGTNTARRLIPAILALDYYELRLPLK
jgi:hypothetical protein